MDIDEESDLTSIEDDQSNAASSDLSSLSSHSGLGDITKNNGAAQNGLSVSRDSVHKSVSLPQLSPSRIGSGISRPVPAAKLKTYGGRKSRRRASFKQPQTPKSSPPRHDSGKESPLTPLSSSPRKRRAPVSAQQTSSSPTKRVKRVAAGNKGYLIKKSVSNPKLSTNGDNTLLSPPSPPMRRKEKGRPATQSKAPASASVARNRRDLLSPDANTWSLETLGSFVWVRTDRKNAIVKDINRESFWWPATVELATLRQRPLQVRVFFPLAGSSSPVLVNIESPSPSNIISYSSRLFAADSFWSLPPSSSRSRPVDFDNIKARWETACKEVLKEDIRVHDGFPTSLAALLSQSLSDSDSLDDDPTSRFPAERVVGGSSPKSPELGSWSPPPPDPNVTVPGEHVLSATKSNGCAGKYYPAKVIAYVAPSSPTIPPKYTVHYMDNVQEDVTRDMFYIYEQEEFGTCKLGVFESVESLNEGDAEDGLDEDIFAETTNRLVLPASPLFPAPPPEKFLELSMLEQSSYIIPILREITENKYKPAEERVSAFLNGGRDRVEMSREAPQKGTLTRLELNQLACIIKCWAFGIGQSNGATRDVSSSREIETHNRSELITIFPPEDDALRDVSSSSDNLLNKEKTNEVQHAEQIASLPPSSLPPSSTFDESPSNTPKVVRDGDHSINMHAFVDEAKPFIDDLRPKHGVEAVANQQVLGPISKSTSLSFRDLLNHEKIHFCTDVLLKEAVIQLLLWRVGKRRVPEPLPDTEEMFLHETGSNLASEFDIAHTVRVLRMKKEKHLQARMWSKQGISTGGTRTRPRKINM